MQTMCQHAYRSKTSVQGRSSEADAILTVGCGEQVTKFITGEMKTPSKKATKDKAAILGKVIIVGAGPAGLAAAKHLQVLPSSSCVGAHANPALLPLSIAAGFGVKWAQGML